MLVGHSPVGRFTNDAAVECLDSSDLDDPQADRVDGVEPELGNLRRRRRSERRCDGWPVVAEHCVLDCPAEVGGVVADQDDFLDRG